MTLVYPYSAIDFSVLTNPKFMNIHTFNFIDNIDGKTNWDKFINYYFHDILSFMMDKLEWKFESKDKEKCIYRKNNKKFVYWTCEPEYINYLEYDYIYLKKQMDIDIKNKQIYTTTFLADKMNIYEYKQIPEFTGKHVYNNLIAKEFNWNKNEWDQIEELLDNKTDEFYVNEFDDNNTNIESFEYDMSGKIVYN